MNETQTELTPAQKAWVTRRANAALPGSISTCDGSAHLFSAREYKVVCLRETPLPSDLEICDVPEKAATFWRESIAKDPHHKSEVESFYVLMLNTRRKVIGYHLVANGTLDTIFVHAREVFRSAIVSNASAIVLMHNHPSGESSPSEADIKVTRDLVKGGQLLKIEVLDHVIIGTGSPGYHSLRELGYFYNS